MEDNISYQVICSGQIKPGYDLQQVEENFAALLKISVEKAKAIVGTKRTLKKDLDPAKAKLYQKKLEDIGLVVLLKANGLEVKQQKSKTSSALSLEPIASTPTLSLEPIETPQNVEPTSSTAPESAGFSCPKCGLEQEKSEQCAGCGVYINKVVPPPESSSPDRIQQTHSSQDSEFDTEKEQAINVMAIAAASVAALLGALAWMGIAVAFGFEFGLVAWLIGGAVGFAAAAFGGHGQISGIMCAALAFVAIFAGKFFAYQSFQSNWVSLVSDEFQSEEFQQAFEEEVEFARLYVDDVYDDQSMRQYMVDYEYSEFLQADQVTDEELQYFKNEIDPFFRLIATESVNFEQWIEASFGSEVEEISTLELMKEDFGLFDILFLFLGLGTAFRLGSGQGRS